MSSGFNRSGVQEKTITVAKLMAFTSAKAMASKAPAFCTRDSTPYAIAIVNKSNDLFTVYWLSKVNPYTKMKHVKRAKQKKKKRIGKFKMAEGSHLLKKISDYAKMFWI
jgi:uncharacterized protein YigE (DUF2233 family)